MKSTDMFPSEESRKECGLPTSLSPQRNPSGIAPSPFVVSLWEEKQIPKAKKSEIEDKELQSIEDLFRGNGRIEHNEYIPPASIFTTDTAPYKATQNPKQIIIPSREEQLKKAQKSRNEYSAVFQKPSISQGGFFRNFGFWK